MKRLWLAASLMAAIMGPANAGDYLAGYAAYESGDYYTAYKEWTAAASEGHRAAQHRLGRMFEEGKGLPQRPKIATKLYIAAADQGYNPAIHRLGVLAEGGDPRAKKWVALREEQQAAAEKRRAAETKQKAEEKKASDAAVAEADEEQDEQDTPSSLNFLEKLFKD